MYNRPDTRKKSHRHSRRDFGTQDPWVAASGSSALLGQKKINSTIGGVLIGAQSYSFREKPLDGVIQAMTEIGLGECEIYSPHIEPKGVSRRGSAPSGV